MAWFSVVTFAALMAVGGEGPKPLPGEPCTKPALPPTPFPDRMSAFVWRNWGLVAKERLCEVVKADPAALTAIAVEMGLAENPVVLPEWKRKGYITVLRRNWHLLPYEQLLTLLDMSRDELRFSLTEDDFLWVKLGWVKPKCDPLVFSADEAKRTRKDRLAIAKTLKGLGLDPQANEEPRFAFVNDLKSVNAAKTDAPMPTADGPFDFRMIFSYFADYGDPLGDPEIGSYPDGLLQKLADKGVNAVWLHAVLRTLAKDPKYPEWGEGSESRIANLRKLVARAEKYGIRVYLYMNEPRGMHEAFFKADPRREAFKGALSEDIDIHALCPSDPEPLRWLSDSLAQVFSQVPGLGGIFTITMSENMTHCKARPSPSPCERCKDRTVGDIIAAVNRAMVEGMLRGNPKAEAIIYTWKWPEGEIPEIMSKLPKSSCRIMTVSEDGMKFVRGGVEGVERDYSISVVGPGEPALGMWRHAAAAGIPCVAKVQVANSWELSTFPYLPVDELNARQAVNLVRAGVHGVMLSWSCGCYPAPNLSVYSELRTGDRTPDALLDRLASTRYGEANVARVRRAWKAFADGFSEFPFDIQVAYNGPQHWGVANPLYSRKTGYAATMVGIPYDDVKGWCVNYPPEVFATQMSKVAKGFAEGCEAMEGVADARELNMFRAEQLHFESSADQVRFVLARDSGDAKAMKRIAARELARAQAYFPWVCADSRIGYESSNHYFFLPRDVLEKALSCCAVLDEPNEWEDPQVNSIGRLPPRTYAMPLKSEADALTDALEPETPYKLSLNGTWRISWAGNPDQRVRGFERVDFDDSDWSEIDVPSCVEMRGFGSPGYTNVRYPHADLGHPTNVYFAAIRDRQSGKPDYNPVSSYRRTFTIPKEWDGRRVILRFDGVYSAYYVWVNGRRVGYAEDSKLPSEFDITEFLTSGDEQSLAVEVYRWSDGSYLEDQDMTRFSGIFRDVTLWSMPKDGIWDFAVRTIPMDGYEKWKLEVKIGDEPKSTPEVEQRMEVSLYDAEHKKVGDLHCSPSTFALDVKNVHTWSAEAPYLYTLVVRKGEDIRMKRIGFKEQKVVGNTMLVNGRKIKFHGVNRHETNPENGRTVSMDDMLADIRLMKRYNIDTVRTSHYPDHHLWYDLCDRYGIYLVAEANVEGHEPMYGEKGLGRFAEWDRTIVERNERHVVFCRNNPSVTMWSLGNETGHGDCFRHAGAAVKSLDPSRPIHWERGCPDADVDSCMYPSVDWLKRRASLGELPRGATNTMERNEWNGENWQSAGKALFVCEYAHAMGNAIGNLDDYWQVIDRHDCLLGGCIWDWIDQAVWKETDKLDPATGRRERYLSYGGDFDEQPNDGPFNCNGVIGPFRKVSAKLVEVGQVYRGLVVSRRKDGTFELWNRYGFTRADAFDGMWELLRDGEAVECGEFDVPPVEPQARMILKLPAFDLTTAGEYCLNVFFRLRSDTQWAEKGWPVSRNQVRLSDGCKTRSMSAGAPKFVRDEKTVTASCGGTRAVFSLRTGTLCELVMKGRTILRDPAEGIAAGPRLTWMRAFTDNDVWLRDWKNFHSCGLTQPRYHVRKMEIEGDRVVAVIRITGSKSAGFDCESTWSFKADGSLSVANDVRPFGAMPVALPRFGLSLRLDESLSNVRWYGRGPEENYVDRCTGSFLGLWTRTFGELEEHYVRPQDNGYRGDVRWVEMADSNGRGVRFSASEPMFFQALAYGWEDLEFARHRNGQQRVRTPLRKDSWINLNLDVRQLGLGGASCGPEPMSEYVFPIGRIKWELVLSPL